MNNVRETDEQEASRLAELHVEERLPVEPRAADEDPRQFRVGSSADPLGRHKMYSGQKKPSISKFYFLSFCGVRVCVAAVCPRARPYVGQLLLSDRAKGFI